MAQSPSHRFGQIIGEVLETAIREPLEQLCLRRGYYLDSKHPRAARSGLSKVAWSDHKDNSHDLDYVVEAEGSDEAVGIPKAFIEIAWRRYTKHSRNKAQEIQGAILPLAEKYHDSHPFLGIILAGEFTRNSINQLRSHGFRVLYFPYGSVIAAFAAAGIDAAYDEATADRDLAKKVAKFAKLTEQKRRRIAGFLRQRHADDLTKFFAEMDICLSRTLVRILILPLHGRSYEVSNLQAAIAFLKSHRQSIPSNDFVRYEICARYSNGDEIRGQFQSKADAIEFVQRMK
jgi:hypothetical protein